MHKIKKAILPLIVAAAAIFGLVTGYYICQNKNMEQLQTLGDMQMTNNKLSQTISLIESLYIDTVNVNELVEPLLPELIKELDPHSVYIPAEDMVEANESLDGEFDGIGVVFNMITDTINILNVIPQGPSDKAGVRNGDRIIEINDSVVAGKKINQNDIVKKLRGQRGTKVTIGVARSPLKEIVPITITRGAIPIKSLDASFMIDSSVGYVKLTAFSRTSFTEVSEAVDNLKKDGMKSLIFDLRGNSGGFLDQAIALTDMFLPKNSLIVYTVDRKGKKVEEFSSGRGSYTEMPIVVLIDESSASSSEILAGALQDNDRGTIVGRRSFGKGLVQQQFPFTDGSAIRLTIARYYTPTGRSIQKPYKKGDVDGYYEEILERYKHREFFAIDSIKFADSLKFTTAKGKVVYGGGGIMPDIFIPLDTTDVTPYFVEVSAKNLILKFSMNYADRHRDKLNSITTIAELSKMLDADKNLLNSFVAYAKSNGVAVKEREIKQSSGIITAHLRAMIGRNSALGDNALYWFLLPIDNTIESSVSILSAKQDAI